MIMIMIMIMIIMIIMIIIIIMFYVCVRDVRVHVLILCFDRELFVLSRNQLFIWQVFQTGPGNVHEKVGNVQRKLCPITQG